MYLPTFAERKRQVPWEDLSAKSPHQRRREAGDVGCNVDLHVAVSRVLSNNAAAVKRYKMWQIDMQSA